jgi:hypothetical protein
MDRTVSLPQPSMCLAGYVTSWLVIGLMSKHKLLELQKIIEETIGSLREEVEISTNVKLNPLYIADRRDEIEFRVWTTRIIQSILNRSIDGQQQLGVNKKRLEMMETIEFENTLQERI